ncbi:MAG: AAA family ATPase [Bacteroidaceae bacterium]|nr:AAA family ATPase [Bacteroidaceae bacterium]
MTAHYEELSAVLRGTANDIRVRYTELYRILCLVLAEATAESRLEFSGPFARLTYLLSEHKVQGSLSLRLNACRGRCRDLSSRGDDELTEALPHDVQAVADLLALVSDKPIPRSLLALLPTDADVHLYRRRLTDYLRVCVTSWDDAFITVVPDEGLQGEPLRVAYADADNRMGHWGYLGPMLAVGSQLNLVRVEDRNGVLYPELIILEPDYLVDVSSIAACFTEHGATPYVHLLRRLQPVAHSRAILLGNLASQMLDEEVNRQDGEEIPYRDTALRFMHRNALELATNREGMDGFHREAQAQQAHIRQLLDIAAHEDSQLHREHLLVEPSFFCEKLGLQGRMDLMQDDYHVLMEQKSGKRAFGSDAHKESHYVQMLLYQAVLHYDYGLRNDAISSYLLYSKYADGLVKEGPAPHLLFRALQLRNQIVWGEFRLSQGGSRVLERLTPEHLNTAGQQGRLWQEFQRPQIAALLDAVQQADELTRAYFHRMTTFVAREHLLSKIGSPVREASGMAALWNSSAEERLVAGNLFAGLHIERTWREDEEGEDGGKGIDFLLLRRPEAHHDYLPNFRQGDIVVVYPYDEGEEPDVRRGWVSRAFIVEIDTAHIVLQLRATQHNAHVFRPDDGRLWAVEHDTTESSFTALYRSVFALLSATAERRKLLLGIRRPQADTTVALQGDYSMGGRCLHFNRLVLQAMQTRDYFLLIGPPGTGKTSYGLMHILAEELLTHSEGVLLLSYTNRAVDEICGKLVEAGMDFLRIGSPQSCPEAYRLHLLVTRAQSCANIDDFRQQLVATRIVVATTTSMTAHQELFQLRGFSLAIVDEASQILEPHLLGLLCAHHGTENAIRRFVLIGDHKQLPAVVQQEEADSFVSDERLRAIGLEDCRESFFQRLLRLEQRAHPQGDSPFVFRFTHQGRMHPEVASFANSHFYGGMLQPVPLPHQQAPLSFPHFDEADPMQQLLASRRMVFLPSRRPRHSDSPKVNTAEALIISRVAYAVYRLYELNDRPFLPESTLGIIVPYRHQIALVRKHIAAYATPLLDQITIDTVERYQGSQRDVIIYGFTVQMPHQLDFLCAQTFEEAGMVIDRRLNVAMTRAREQMVLVGNPRMLALNSVLKDIIWLEK